MTSVLGPRISVPAMSHRTVQAGELDAANNAFAAAVVRQQGLDPVLTELVRLRCARVHDCRLCGSLRSDAAMQVGLDEAMATKIDRYESSDLDERAKVALRLTDAMIMDPSGIGAPLRAQVREHFSDAEVAELALDIMKWSYQKTLVALRLEAPAPAGHTTLSFDDEGHAHIG